MTDFAPQGTKEWASSRYGLITGSRFKDVLAEPTTAAYRGYLLQLALERLTGESHAPKITSTAIEHGTTQEPFAKAAYEVHTGELLTPCGFIRHGSIAFAGASPDALIGSDGVWEAKCPNSTTHVDYWRAKKLPSIYRAQVQGEMWVTGRSWAHFVSFDPRLPAHLRLLIVDVKRDETYIEALEAAVSKFNAAIESLLAELQWKEAA